MIYLCGSDMSEEQIFAKALLIEDAEERQRFLRSACNGNEVIFDRVNALLESANKSDSLLDKPIELLETDSFKRTMVPTSQQIGPYKLLHLLGEGGMGTVYLAEQQEPVKRRVAVKFIKQGLNNRQFIARFEAERQALAIMDHPNIAKVLDAGNTNDGQNYFVMEFVKGVPITKFCDENRLDTDERLRLFVKVCQAVQHAHQKGIIHRDLKPSNVIVAMYDDQPVPKVIDFGVAKATHQPLTEQTLCTIPGQIVGTWEYMSPEQAILNQLDVDTRTDVYSLGVILYEMLTGHTPLDLKSLRPEQLEERLRRIREQEPSRPSIRASSVENAKSPSETYRRTSFNSMSKTRRSDLDWLVMKALEKERSQRYSTASNFGEEILRFLEGESLSFRPPSQVQQIKRFVSRNKTFVGFASLALFSLAAIAGLMAWSLKSQLKSNEVLRKEQNRYRKLMSKYEPLIVNSIIDDVFSGDTSSAKLAIEDADELGVTSKQVDLLRAIQQIFSGEQNSFEDGIRHFEAKVEAGEDLEVSCTALLWAHSSGYGDTKNLWELIKKRPKHPPTQKDQLQRVIWAAGLSVEGTFLGVEGVGVIGDELRQSEKILEEVIASRPGWSLPRVLLLRTKSEIAIDTGSLEVVATAISENQPFLEQAPNLESRPYYLAQLLRAYHVAMELSPETGREMYQMEAAHYANKLERFETYRIGRLERALFFTTLAREGAKADLEKAIAEWEIFDPLATNDVYSSMLGALLLRYGLAYGDFSKATKFYETTPLPFVGYMQGDRNKIKRSIENLKPDENSVRQVLGICIPVHLRKAKSVKERSSTSKTLMHKPISRHGFSFL